MNDLILSHLCKAYDGRPVLQDFSAVLKAGRVTALMAPSGSGKTTLLRILMGLTQADSGEIRGLEGLRISPVFQEDRLCLFLSPVDNLRLVSPGLSREAASQALTQVGLGDCLNRRTEALSGGMRRRVAILRALLSDGDLLLLDEPFRGLDRDTKALIMSDTAVRWEGRTVLLVTHDPTELQSLGIETCLTL